MLVTLTKQELEKYIIHLLLNHLPDNKCENYDFSPFIGQSLDRLEYCFNHINKKYYQDEKGVLFDHLNSDHMCSFIWYLSNTIWIESGGLEMPTRLFYLNKIMHGIDLFYSILMPDIFLLVHPLGTVIGKANYKNYLVVYQNCTIGADTDIYPSFGTEIILYSRSSVIGECNVGSNVIFTANSFIVDTNVPSNSLVLGQYPTHKFAPNRSSVKSRCF